MSRRCSCWPKKAISRPPRARRSATDGRTALHEGTGAPVRAHAARQDDLVQVRPDPLEQVRQRGIGEQLGGGLEDALDVRLARARPDDPAARLAAHQQVERMRQHGLARAGLAGDHREAAARPQLGALDQQQVLDAQLQEHGACLPAAPRRSGRTQNERRPNLSRRRE